MIEFWAIKHKPTGFFLPEPEGYMGRGGSHVEPTNPKEKRPRLFKSPIGARNALSQWLSGQHCAYGNGEDYEVRVVPVPTRIKADMEIVKFVASETP